VFTLFHKPPYTYPYGRSVDETTTVGAHLNEITKFQTAFFLGPKCFGQQIRDEPIPHGFKIEKNIRQYNGVDRPLTWLQDYFNTVQFAGGSPNVAVRYLPLMLSGTARQWINDLVENSIQTWFDM
jgi:hypothetical protein